MALEKKQGHPAEPVPVSAYGGSSKKLKGLKSNHRNPQAGDSLLTGLDPPAEQRRTAPTPDWAGPCQIYMYIYIERERER